MSSYPSRPQTNSSRIRREKIIVGYDPIVLRLDGPPTGLETQSNYGNGIEFQYFVNDNSGTIYLPAAGRDAIIASGAQAGDQIEICKSQRGRAVSYVVFRVNDAQEPPPPAAPPAPAARAVAVMPAPQQPAERMTAEVRGTAISTCLRVAIDDLIDARDYAKERGIALDEPNFEDVRAIAISYYIQRSKA